MSLAIKDAQSIFTDESIRLDLTFNLAHLSSMPDFITSLEKQGLPLIETFSILRNAKAKL